MNDKTIEQQIQAKGLNAPRVTPADIEGEIECCYYIVAGDAHRANWPDPNACDRTHPSLDLLTFCVLVLRNGFTVTGESACASPENFDAEIGRTIARQNAVAKIWPLLGFRLRDRLAASALTEADSLADLAGTPRPDHPTVA